MKKSILIGLLVVLAILFVPTPQRPIECGGGSVIWNKETPPENAEYMNRIMRETSDYEILESYKPNSLKTYWSESGGRILMCNAYEGYGGFVITFNEDSPMVQIMSLGTFGVE